MPVGKPRQFIEPAAAKLPESVEMRREMRKIICRKIQCQQIAQGPVDCVEILSRTVGRDVIGAAARDLHACVLRRSLR